MVETKLSSLSIPGTHDSMSNGPGGSLAMHHGTYFLNSMFGDVMNDSIDFLKKNPSEVIFMRVKQEYSSVSDAEFIATLNKYLEATGCAPYVYKGNNKVNPTLGEMRGKIVVIRNFAGSTMGIHYNSQFDIQDNYKLGTNWDLYDKWISVKQHLDKANTNYANENKYINYLTGSVGSFPYFVASGHSSPGTSAPRLATGLTHPGWKNSYPDFPRTDWFLGIATIAFEGTNVLTTSYVRNGNLRNVGIVVSDFPGPGLINNIIGLNYVYSKPERIPDGIYSIITNLNHRKSLDFSIPERNAILWDSHDNNNQKFEFRYDENQKAYQIFNKQDSNIVMGWNNFYGSIKDNKIFLKNDSVTGQVNEQKDEQYWILEKDGSDLVIFKNKKDPNLVLDVDHYKTDNGTTVKMNERHPVKDGGAQRFTLKVNY